MAQPPNARAKCGNASRYCCGLGHAHRQGGSPLKAKVNAARHRSASAAIAVRMSGAKPWDTRLSLWLDVLVQGEEVLRVVLLFDSHESLIVGTERRFYRIFALFSEVIQIVRMAREGTYRIGRSSSPFDMEWRLSWLRPLCEEDKGILGLTLRKSSFGDSNPTRSSAIVLDNYSRKRRRRPVRVLHKQGDRIIAELAQEGRFPVVVVTVRKRAVQ